jgi:hypothetical protein
MSKPIICRWDEYCRVIKIGLVNVTQDIRIDTFKPDEPQINWHCIGSTDVKEAQKLIADLKQAVALYNVLKTNKIPWERPPISAGTYTLFVAKHPKIVLTIIRNKEP